MILGNANLLLGLHRLRADKCEWVYEAIFGPVERTRCWLCVFGNIVFSRISNHACFLMEVTRQCSFNTSDYQCILTTSSSRRAKYQYNVLLYTHRFHGPAVGETTLPIVIIHGPGSILGAGVTQRIGRNFGWLRTIVTRHNAGAGNYCFHFQNIA